MTSNKQIKKPKNQTELFLFSQNRQHDQILRINYPSSKYFIQIFYNNDNILKFREGTNS